MKPNHSNSTEKTSVKIRAMRRRPALPKNGYILDSTLLDIYVLEESRRNSLGRPRIYLVIDLASRAVAGMHIAIGIPKPDDVRKALESAVSDKVAFCARHNVQISPHEWPHKGMPEVVFLDRANLFDPEAEKLGVRIYNIPPNRGDLKGIVERAFQRLQDDLFSPDPRPSQKSKASLLTLPELTKFIIWWVLIRNNEFLEGTSKPAPSARLLNVTQ